jgi:hypothetical protein
MLAAASLVLALAAASPVTPPERWIEVAARPRDEAQALRLAELGWEMKEADDGASIVYLPASALPSLAATGVPHVVVEGDLEAYYAARLVRAKSLRGSMGGYLTLSEAVDAMDALVVAHPGLVAPKTALGMTEEGRPIWAWKLSANVLVDEPEPVALFMALMHAREPAGLMSIVHFAERLVGDYGADAEATWLLDHREIWIIPVLNPDGYAWNEAQQPGGGGMWRKNRRVNGDGTFGVDPNRNFSYSWGIDDLGSSPDTASDTYRGPAPMSEPETQVLRDFAALRAPTISVNTHAHGDHLVRPWGYTNGSCSDDAIMDDLSGLALREAAYLPGNAAATLGYLANGDHDDYMWAETTEKPRAFGFTPELGNATDGFWPATSRIDPLCEETYPMHELFAWAAGAAPRLDSFSIDDAAPGGDGDGLPEPGETIGVTVVLRNHGLEDTPGVIAATLESDTCAALVEDAAAQLGVIASQSSLSNGADPFVVHLAASATPGDLARLRLILADSSGAYPPIPLAFLMGEPTVLLAEDFESGLATWDVAGFGTSAAGAGRAGQALSDSFGGNYGNDVDATAGPSAPLDLSGFGRAWLVFDQRFWIDNDFDAASVEVLPGGGSWTPVAGETSAPGSGVGAQVAGAPTWDGRRLAWELERVDLSSFTGPGPPVSLRFRFRSDAAFGYDGWHVDDVKVLGFPPVDVQSPDEPLLMVSKGDLDVTLAWSSPFPGPAHSAADVYTAYRSSSVRGDGGFAPFVTTRGLAATDADAVPAASDFAYTIVATNCAGASSDPAP